MKGNKGQRKLRQELWKVRQEQRVWQRSREGQGKREKGKGKGQGKDKKPAPNSSFQGYCRSCGKWVHKASECWQGFVQAVEEVPRSSASSVAPSAATTPAAAKTAASIQEITDEDRPGWIFGVMDESAASVTTDTDDLWGELVFMHDALTSV